MPNIVPSVRPRYMRVQGRSAGALVATPENKYFDATLAVTALPATAVSWASTERDPTTLNTLFAPIQGTGINNRIGRKVSVHKLKVRGTLTFTQFTGGALTANYLGCRLVLVQDLQTNGAQLNGEDVMAASATASSENQMVSYQNLANFGRYRVLKDKSYQFRYGIAANNASATTVSTDFPSIDFNFSIKFRKPVVVHFNATNGGTIADIVDNSFHILALANSTSVNILYESRVVFQDN